MAMRYTDLIFDLYGTLVDIHTEESDAVWEKTALYLGFYGVSCTAQSLQADFRTELLRREAVAGQSCECWPDIPFEQVLEALVSRAGADEPQALSIRAAQLFRVCSIEYLRLYPYVKEALHRLRQSGCRLWLLTNAQQVFTAYELRLLGLDTEFDGIRISSDYGFRKPDVRFFRALLQEEGLDPRHCLMIGNDLETDIAGAKQAGLSTVYMHTGLTPPDQPPADSVPLSGGRSFAFEGSDWQALTELLVDIIG